MHPYTTYITTQIWKLCLTTRSASLFSEIAKTVWNFYGLYYLPMDCPLSIDCLRTILVLSMDCYDIFMVCITTYYLKMCKNITDVQMIFSNAIAVGITNLIIFGPFFSFFSGDLTSLLFNRQVFQFFFTF